MSISNKNIEIYKKLLELLIRIKSDSLKDSLLAIKKLELFNEEYLQKLICNFSQYSLTELSSDGFPGVVYYVLKLGEKYYYFTEKSECTCSQSIKEKIENKNICVHSLVFMILLKKEIISKKKIEEEKMWKIIKRMQTYI